MLSQRLKTVDITISHEIETGQSHTKMFCKNFYQLH